MSKLDLLCCCQYLSILMFLENNVYSQLLVQTQQNLSKWFWRGITFAIIFGNTPLMVPCGFTNPLQASLVVTTVSSVNNPSNQSARGFYDNALTPNRFTLPKATNKPHINNFASFSQNYVYTVKIDQFTPVEILILVCYFLCNHTRWL